MKYLLILLGVIVLLFIVCAVLLVVTTQPVHAAPECRNPPCPTHERTQPADTPDVTETVETPDVTEVVNTPEPPRETPATEPPRDTPDVTEQPPSTLAHPPHTPQPPRDTPPPTWGPNHTPAWMADKRAAMPKTGYGPQPRRWVIAWALVLGVMLVLAVGLMACLRVGSDDDDRAGRG